jgi:hypothetical protein
MPVAQLGIPGECPSLRQSFVASPIYPPTMTTEGSERMRFGRPSNRLGRCHGVGHVPEREAYGSNAPQRARLTDAGAREAGVDTDPEASCVLPTGQGAGPPRTATDIAT